MGKRWAIYIDIEGFSKLRNFIDQPFLALRHLMEGIYQIGQNFFKESPNRIFAHQIVDGFVIVSEFYNESLEMPIAISIALLRHVAAGGGFAKASIGEGHWGDITGCYPNFVIESQIRDHTVSIGNGIMTLFPCMGTALISAYKVHKDSPSGSLLTVESSNCRRLPTECILKECNDIISVDWVHSNLSLVSKIQVCADLRTPTIKEIEVALIDYASIPGTPEKWVDSTSRLLNISITSYNNKK